MKVINISLDDTQVESLRAYSRREFGEENLSAAVRKLVGIGLQSNRAKVVELKTLSTLQDLPRTLRGVPLDHPIFKKGRTGLGPYAAITVRA